MRTIRHRTSALLTALALGGLGGLATAGPAHAGTWVTDVTNPADDGSDTTLRAAVDRANTTAGDWTIRLRPDTTYVLDRLCQHGDPDDDHGGDLDITTDADVTIVGGEGTTIAVQCTGERALHHLGTGTLRLEGLTITGGNTADGVKGQVIGDHTGGSAGAGGAVLSTGTVAIRQSRFVGNRTGNGGAGVKPGLLGKGGDGGHGGAGGAVYASTVTLTDTLVEGNTSGHGGAAGAANGAGNDGGNGGNGGNGAVVAGSVTLERSTLRDNAAGDGGAGGDSGAGGHAGEGGIGGSGGGASGFSVRATATTFAGNRAGDGGTGGDGTGGGLQARGGNGGNGGGVATGLLTLERSTVHANTAGARGTPGSGAGLVPNALSGRGGGVATSGATTIAWSTITANSAASAANVLAPAAATLTASIIAGRTGGGSDCSNALTSLGGNVVEVPACGAGADDRVIADMDGALSVLVDGGGPTPTRLPWPDGALADLLPLDVCTALLGDVHADQRGEPRPYGDGCEPGAVELGPTAASSFVPLPPTRALDTREPGELHGAFAAGETRTMSFMGVLGVPMQGATAIAMNVTVTDAAGPGFVTVFPPGVDRPLASSVNTIRTGQTVPNFVIAPLGTEARVSFYAQTGGHLVVDVVGYFVPAVTAADGRIVPVAPQRFFDTRTTDDGPGISGKLGPGEESWVSVTSEIGLPNVEHIAAVVMNVTATEATAAGYVTFWAHGQPRPLASTLNLAGPGDTSANLTIVPVGDDGGISMYTQSGAHLLADIVGYVTDTTAPTSSQGLFVPLTPARVFDTRTGVPAGGYVYAGETIEVPFAGVAGIPSWAGAAVMNVTATDAGGPGYVTGWPGALGRPLASTLNLNHTGETRANGSIMPIGTDGAIDFYSQSGAHLLADVTGYLLPDPKVLTGS